MGNAFSSASSGAALLDAAARGDRREVSRLLAGDPSLIAYRRLHDRATPLLAAAGLKGGGQGGQGVCGVQGDGFWRARVERVCVDASFPHATTHTPTHTPQHTHLTTKQAPATTASCSSCSRPR
jgi:hypothetical protein